MDKLIVKDVMIPIEEYAVVDENATLLEAVKALDESQKKLAPGKYFHRAVLVRDSGGKIIGKLGHLAFLKALEPRYNNLGDLRAFSHAGMTPEFLSDMMEHLNFWKENLTDVLKKAGRIKVKDVMHSATEHIDENASLTEAIHLIIIWQTLSLLVTRQGNVVGIIRLADLYSVVAGKIKELG